MRFFSALVTFMMFDSKFYNKTQRKNVVKSKNKRLKRMFKPLSALG